MLASLWVIALWYGPAQPAARSESNEACTAAFVEAQRQRHASALLRARELLGACAQPACPALVRDKCTGWLSEILTEVPSAHFVVRDAAGRDVDTRVLVDGAREVPVGVAVELDPGAHTAQALDPPVERAFTLVPGQHAVVALGLPAAPNPAPAPSPALQESQRSLLRGAIVGGATAAVELVVLGAAGLLSLAGIQDETSLGPIAVVTVAVVAPSAAAAIFQVGLDGERPWVPAIGAVAGCIVLAVTAGLAASAIAPTLPDIDPVGASVFAASVGAVAGAGVGAGVGSLAADALQP
ncbi:MAG: hypothetical protein A2138_21260 [Deltaproteobacteria bacterium RBG_16_71_12]|nr:MAG: hypothetical protein A2138_21260 [Deltaproteobacteria bacterium RBG_16_71_12]